MKQGCFKAGRLIVLLFVMLSLTVVSGFGDENTVDIASIVIETFGGESTRQWTAGGRQRTYEFEWRLEASKFASTIGGEEFPQLAYVEAWPIAAFGTNRDEDPIKSLGI